MKKILLFIVISILAVSILSACGGSAEVTPKNINSTKANEIYNQGSALFLDVREVEEWNQFHIPGATLIPLGELESRVSELPKDQEIVVYCRSGNRSQSGRDILLAAGFTNVTSMDGGINDWYNKGYQVEQ